MECYTRFTERLTVRRAEGERYLLRRGAPVIDPSYGDAGSRGSGGGQRGGTRVAGDRGGVGRGGGREDLTFLVAGCENVAGWSGDRSGRGAPGDPLALLVAAPAGPYPALGVRGRPPRRSSPNSRTRADMGGALVLPSAGRPRPPGPTGRSPQGGSRRPAAARRHLAAHREQLQQLCHKSGSRTRGCTLRPRVDAGRPEGSPLGELVRHRLPGGMVPSAATRSPSS